MLYLFHYDGILIMQGDPLKGALNGALELN